MKKSLAVILILAAAVSLFGCSKKIEYTSSQNTSSVTREEDLGEINPITGERGFQKNALGTRPLAIMVSNIKIALPQYGIGSADMCYEVLAEGGITRIMAVFANKNTVPKIGPVRSVRDYYVDLAEGLNAILIHYGGSPKGYSVINSYGTDHVDGLTTESAFVRDNKLAASKGREHSNFTKSELFLPIIRKREYQTKIKPYSAFKFVDEGEKADMSEGVQADSVTVPFSGYCKATFKYSAKSGKYLKGEFGEKQIDANTGKQIAVKNVFVLYTTCYQIPGDKHGRIAVDLDEGKGKYLTDGMMIDITWKKGEHDDKLTFYDANGRTLYVNRGKSWICIVPEGNDVIRD